MTPIAAAGVVMGKPRVMEQAIAEGYLPRILDWRRWDRRNWFLPRRLRLRDRPPCGAKSQKDQDQARCATSGSGADRRQAQAVARGPHGQFINQ